MRSRRGWLLSHLLLAGAALGCKRTLPTASVKESGAGVERPFREVFEAVIGRPPAESEANLNDSDYAKMVGKVIASSAYRDEGFFSLHEDRLLLQKFEAREAWSRASHLSYCALKREMQAAADQDRDGDGYWSLLRYRKRWVPLPKDSAFSCFFGVKAADLAAFMKPRAGKAEAPEGSGMSVGATGTPSDAAASDPAAAAADPAAAASDPAAGAADPAAAAAPPSNPAVEVCAASLNFLAADNRSPEEQKLGPKSFPTRADLDALLAALKTAGAADASGTLLDSDGGKDFFRKLVVAQLKGANIDLEDPVVPMTGGKPSMLLDASDDPLGLQCKLDVVTDFSTVTPVTSLGHLLEVTVPARLAGVHASPFWLARHQTSETNRNLHRSRMVYYSYFCQDINPEAAQGGGGAANVHPDLVKYFPTGDQHAFGANTCYKCHATLQPLGNYFRDLSDGIEFDSPRALDLGFAATRKPEDVPGGLWQWKNATDGAFFGRAGEHYDVKGIGGFAAVMSDPNFPRAAQCIVKSAWSRVFGNQKPMPDEWAAAAVRAFRQGDGGKNSLAALMKHLLTTDYGAAKFSGADGDSFEDILARAAGTCDDAKATTGWTGVKDTCNECHADYDKALKADRARRSTAYCRVYNGDMPDGPPPGWTPAMKANVLCAFRKAGVANESCAQKKPDSAPHPVTGAK